MEKVLMLTTVASTNDQFNMPNIKMLIEMGYEVHIACNFERGSTFTNERCEQFQKELDQMGVRSHHINFSRSVADISCHIEGYRTLKALVISNNYRFIHCHTPIAGALGRLVGHKTNTLIIYTAHGFHFFCGGSKLNWLLYYPVERYLSRYTDLLITINKEDYERAKTFKAGRVIQIPGVGVQTNLFVQNTSNRDFLQKEGIPENAFVALSIGELNDNKNHSVIIKALAKIDDPYLYYLICGQGSNEQKLKGLAEALGVSDRVKLLGFRNDVTEICQSADLFVFPSKREGLSLALMEAMASSLPCLVSDIRGNRDLIGEKGGFLLPPEDIVGFAEKMAYCANLDRGSLEKMGQVNKANINAFSQEKVNSHMWEIYNWAGEASAINFH